MRVVCEIQSLRGSQKEKKVIRFIHLCEIIATKCKIVSTEENFLENDLFSQLGDRMSHN